MLPEHSCDETSMALAIIYYFKRMVLHEFTAYILGDDTSSFIAYIL